MSPENGKGVPHRASSNGNAQRLVELASATSLHKTDQLEAQPILFPPRGPFAVCVIDDEDGWLVVCRSYGWPHGDQLEAIADAEFVAGTFGVAVKVSS